MKYDLGYAPPPFSWTSRAPCPYIEGKFERRLVAGLGAKNPIQLHNELSKVGFRRSHGSAYKPVCSFCQECISVRIVLPDFLHTRSQKRVLLKNRDVFVERLSTEATYEQYNIFLDYQSARHNFGEMSKMDFFDYKAMIEETPIESSVVEFRSTEGTLMAVLLLDEIDSGLSAAYSFFDPSESKRSLGTFMILWLVKYARDLSKKYVYLGFLVRVSQKMSYKGSFQPLEGYINGCWKKI